MAKRNEMDENKESGSALTHPCPPFNKREGYFLPFLSGFDRC